MTYKILRIVNNNVVISLDASEREVVLRGKGIGFQKKPGMELDEDAIEKVYSLQDAQSDKIYSYLNEIPMEYFLLVEQMLKQIQSEYQIDISTDSALALVDHIHFAIKRAEEGMLFHNPLLFEIRTYYPNEFMAGKKAIDYVNMRLNVNLPEDEAGFIALHFVNSNLGNKMDWTYKITEMISGSLKVVEEFYGMPLKEGTVNYSRMITHLKFFGQRLFKREGKPHEEEFLAPMVQERYPNEYACACKVGEYIEQTYHKEVGEEEKTFLAIHLRRLQKDLKSNENV